jgi:hypothetical protein
MNPTGRTKLFQFKTLRIILFVFRGGIIAAFAGCASQRYHDAILFAFASHFLTPFMFLTWPATLLDKSRSETVMGASDNCAHTNV